MIGIRVKKKSSNLLMFILILDFDLVTPQQPQEPSKPNDSYMNIQVGDGMIIKQGNQTLVDTLKGIDNREYKKAIEQEMDRVKKLRSCEK